MKRSTLLALFAFATGGLTAQPPQEEKALIKEMCGCHRVEFKYAETFSENPDYQYHDRYQAYGLEWIFVDEESPDKLVLQHLLVINDSTIIKHWRQDWLYENRALWEYRKNLEWQRRELSAQEAEGTWTQKVYQVDDSPRYEGHATWITADGKKYWESQVDAPLPRREATKRSDYNVMLRTNKHRITSYGHVHELDNAKIIRTADEDSVLVWEKGLNTYTKVNDSLCAPARRWWSEHKTYWRDVRLVWNDILADEAYINIQKEIEGQKLWQKLFALGDQYAETKKYRSKAAQEAIREAIAPYLSDQPSPWQTARTEQADPKKSY